MLRYYLFFLLLSLIKSCPLKTVDSRSGCYCGIEIDGTNYVQCQPHSIEVIPEFTRSYIYDKLNLSSNFIRNITPDSFNKIRVKKIYIQQNLIEFIDKQSFNNNILNHLEELHMDVLKNGSLEFICYGTWQKLRVLELSGFNLNEYQNCFEKFDRLEKLIIRNSHVKFLSHYVYQLPHLYELVLTNNQIEYLNFDSDLLTTISSVRTLNLSSNRLRTIPLDLFHRMSQLHTLDLSHNLIESLPIIDQLTSLTIDLSYNLINYIDLNDSDNKYDLSFNPICTLEKSVTKKQLILKHLTQLHCDCRLAFYLDEYLINKSETIDVHLLFDEQIQCSTPTAFQGLFLKDLTYEQLYSTCSNDLPAHCREVSRIEEVRQYTNTIMETTTKSSTVQTTRNTTQIIEMIQQWNNQPELASFRLTSFYTIYKNNTLTVYWDFDSNVSINDLSSIKFQLILEQESSSNNQIIRRSGQISPDLKQYVVHHVPSNKNYYVCLLLTRSSFGTDKYCREVRTIVTTTTTIANAILSKQAFTHMLFTNRSIVFGFLFGTILTTSLLLALAFLYHLRSKRQHYHRASSSLFHQSNPHQQQKHYLYVDRNDDDGTYSNSVFSSSSSSSKYNHFRRSHQRTCFLPLASDRSWYHRGSTQLPTTPLSPPCCFHHHHHHQHTPDTTMSSSATARRIASLSSQYSNDADREQMTSTSIMSSTSSDEQPSNSPAKHVYEELADETTILRHHGRDAYV